MEQATALPPVQGESEWLIPGALFASRPWRSGCPSPLFSGTRLMIHEQDGVAYIAVAKRMLAFSSFFNIIRPPGYPAVIALFSVLPLEMEHAGTACLHVHGCPCRRPPLFSRKNISFQDWCGSRHFSVGIFLVRAVFFSVSAQPVHLPLFSGSGCSVFCEGSGEALHWSLFFASGIFFALSYLSRPEGVVSFAAAGAIVVLLARWREQRLRLIRGVISLGCGFLLAAGPYLIFLRLSLGYWALCREIDVALKTIDGALTLDRTGKLTTLPHGFRAWLEHYGTFAGFKGAVYANVTQFALVVYRTFPWWFFVAAAAGLVLLALRKRWLTLAVFCAASGGNLSEFIVNIPKTHSYLTPCSLFSSFCSWCRSMPSSPKTNPRHSAVASRLQRR